MALWKSAAAKLTTDEALALSVFGFRIDGSKLVIPKVHRLF